MFAYGVTLNTYANAIWLRRLKDYLPALNLISQWLTPDEQHKIERTPSRSYARSERSVSLNIFRLEDVNE